LSYQKGGAYQSETTYSLDEFSKIQKKNRNKIKEAIKYCSNNCRVFIQNGFNKSIHILREQNKNNFPKKVTTNEPITKKIQKNYGPSSK